MTDDLLERAAAVVRKRYDGSTADAGQTERRLLLALRAREKRGTRAPLLALPLVAALAASAAWGSVSESTRAGVRSALHGLLRDQAASAPSMRAHPLIAQPSAVPAEPLPPSVASATSTSGAAAPPAAPSSSAPRRAVNELGTRALRVEPAAAPQLERAPLIATETEIRALYRAAHHAQFAGGDPAQTLALWDRYLAAAPNGSLSPEAKYNRAITLVRLGRKAEAASALEPFARGDYGAYRQNEANALLSALRPAPAP